METGVTFHLKESAQAQENTALRTRSVALWKKCLGVAVALVVVWQFYYFRELAAALLIFTIFLFLMVAAIAGAIYLVGRAGEKGLEMAELRCAVDCARGRDSQKDIPPSTLSALSCNTSWPDSTPGMPRHVPSSAVCGRPCRTPPRNSLNISLPSRPAFAEFPAQLLRHFRFCHWPGKNRVCAHAALRAFSGCCARQSQNSLSPSSKWRPTGNAAAQRCSKYSATAPLPCKYNSAGPRASL